VGCRSILLEISNWEFLIVQLIYKGVEDFHICSCCDGCIEKDGTNYAPPGYPTPNANLLWMRGFFMYRIGIFTCPNTGILRINISRQVKPPKKFRQWQRTYWQGLSKIWHAGFNPVWTQMVATSSTCYDVVTFLTQWGKSSSNFVAISSLMVKLLKNCQFGSEWDTVYLYMYFLFNSFYLSCIIRTGTASLKTKVEGGKSLFQNGSVI